MIKKKSEILQYVLDNSSSNDYVGFICCRIQDAIDDKLVSAKKGKTLIKWIEDSIGEAQGSMRTGVIAWLRFKGHIPHDAFWYTLEWQSCWAQRVDDYRRAWLQNMIEYWQYQGD